MGYKSLFAPLRMIAGSRLEQHPQREGRLVDSAEALQSWDHWVPSGLSSPALLGVSWPGAYPGPCPLELGGQHPQEWFQRGDITLESPDLKMAGPSSSGPPPTWALCDSSEDLPPKVTPTVTHLPFAKPFGYPRSIIFSGTTL